MYAPTSGDTAPTGKSLFSEGAQALQNVLTDPALPRIQLLLAKLNKIDPSPSGIGLSDVVVPLRAYVYSKRNPWVVPVVVLAFLGIPLLAGYLTAKGRR